MAETDKAAPPTSKVVVFLEQAIGEEATRTCKFRELIEELKQRTEQGWGEEDHMNKMKVSLLKRVHPDVLLRKLKGHPELTDKVDKLRDAMGGFFTDGASGGFSFEKVHGLGWQSVEEELLTLLRQQFPTVQTVAEPSLKNRLQAIMQRRLGKTQSQENINESNGDINKVNDDDTETNSGEDATTDNAGQEPKKVGPKRKLGATLNSKKPNVLLSKQGKQMKKDSKKADKESTVETRGSEEHQQAESDGNVRRSKRTRKPKKFFDE